MRDTGGGQPAGRYAVCRHVCVEGREGRGEGGMCEIACYSPE